MDLQVLHSDLFYKVYSYIQPLMKEVQDYKLHSEAVSHATMSIEILESFIASCPALFQVIFIQLHARQHRHDM